jgi:hypothetical protein
MRFGLAFWNSLSVRARLILVFIAIKVVPLVLLVWIAWNQTLETAGHLGVEVEGLADTAGDAANACNPEALYVASLPPGETTCRNFIECRRLDAEMGDREADFRPSQNNSSPAKSTSPTSSAPAPVRGSLASSSSRRGLPGNAAFPSSREKTLAPSKASDGKRRAAHPLA